MLEFRKSERDLISVTRVCARRRTILPSTPSLWTKINFEDSSRAALYLERSKAALVDAIVGKTRSHIVSPEGAFLGAIPWVARMESLSIQECLQGTDNRQTPPVSATVCYRYVLTGMCFDHQRLEIWSWATQPCGNRFDLFFRLPCSSRICRRLD